MVVGAGGLRWRENWRECTSNMERLAWMRAHFEELGLPATGALPYQDAQRCAVIRSTRGQIEWTDAPLYAQVLLRPPQVVWDECPMNADYVKWEQSQQAYV